MQARLLQNLAWCPLAGFPDRVEIWMRGVREGVFAGGYRSQVGVVI